jgi:hypothetical protein
MFALKPISPESVSGALAKAERYRLINEPAEAESICRDILELEPENPQALTSLILALTDQIPEDSRAFGTAVSTIARLASPYERAYYAGIAWERRAKARFMAGGQGSRQGVYDWIVNALQLFEEAERLRAHGNDDAVLRWNACVRFLDRNKQLAPHTEEMPEPIASE